MFLLRRIPSKKFNVKYLSTLMEEHWEAQGPLVHLLDEKPPQTVELTKENGITLFTKMHLIRRIEEACGALYRKKLIRGFCHLYLGQEAVAVGINAVLSPQDTVITSYRCHGWVILKSPDLVGIFAELLGNSTGLSKGRGGSMHLYADNFYGGNGIVGAQVPLGVGIALKHQYANSGGVSVTCMGDGAFNQGQVSEAFNFAKLHNLPVLFLVENNCYGMGTSTRRSSAFDKYYKWSASIPGIRTNGMEILSVMAATKFALNRIREGKGPMVLEVMTYRYSGHSLSDPGTSYRDQSEVKKVRDERDCIKNLTKLLIDSNLATETELETIKTENKKISDKALAEAEKTKPSPKDELIFYIYTNYLGKIKMVPALTEIAYKNKH